MTSPAMPRKGPITDAVILAGGAGTRLRPFTISIPKPLVPLGDVPIVEVLMRQLAADGFTRVHLALGHLAELMRAYFDQMNSRHGVEVVYSREEEPLGTVGPLRNIQGLGDNFLVVNGDILTTLSFRDVADRHQASGHIATLAVHRRTLPVDYGVIDLSPDGLVLAHREKPQFDLTVGMGVYVFSRRIIDFIPPRQRFDLPDLLRILQAGGEPIAAFQSDDYWMDIGRPEDYESAHRDYVANPGRFARGGPVGGE